MFRPIQQELALGAAARKSLKWRTGDLDFAGFPPDRQLFMAFVCAWCLSRTHNNANNALFSLATEQRTELKGM